MKYSSMKEAELCGEISGECVSGLEKVLKRNGIETKRGIQYPGYWFLGS